MRGASVVVGCVPNFKTGFPPVTESGVSVICILLYATAPEFELHPPASRLPPAFARLPVWPESRVLHLLVEPGFMNHLLQFRARLPRPDPRRIIGERKRGHRRNRHVPLQLGDIHLVERVRR